MEIGRFFNNAFPQPNRCWMDTRGDVEKSRVCQRLLQGLAHCFFSSFSSWIMRCMEIFCKCCGENGDQDRSEIPSHKQNQPNNWSPMCCELWIIVNYWIIICLVVVISSDLGCSRERDASKHCVGAIVRLASLARSVGFGNRRRSDKSSPEHRVPRVLFNRVQKTVSSPFSCFLS